jgi:hypothetical protein
MLLRHQKHSMTGVCICSTGQMVFAPSCKHFLLLSKQPGDARGAQRDHLPALQVIFPVA